MPTTRPRSRKNPVSTDCCRHWSSAGASAVRVAVVPPSISSATSGCRPASSVASSAAVRRSPRATRASRNAETAAASGLPLQSSSADSRMARMLLPGAPASARSRSTRSPHSPRANRFFARSAHSAGGLRPAAIAAECARAQELGAARAAIANASSRTRPGLQSSATRRVKSSSSSSSSASTHSWFSASCFARAFASMRPSSSWRGITSFVLEPRWCRRVPRPGQAMQATGVCFDGCK